MDKEDIEIDYAYLTQNALRGVVHDALALTAELGDAPGEHHFYIEFSTVADGVEIPGHLRETYPERMTIVLQHRFYDLIVTPEHFAVTLTFNREPSRLVIPFEAVLSFADPSVHFGLRFEPAHAPEEIKAENEDSDVKNFPGKVEPLKRNADAPRKPAPKDDANKTDPDDPPPAGGDVVSLDKFRKK